MAGTLALNVEILGEFKKLTTATQGAQGTLGSLNDRAKKISTSMNRAFAAIGVGFSLAAVVNQLKLASEAAIEDQKSMELLSIAMINTGKATKGTVAEVEKIISKMQIQSSVADDDLRPAFQRLFIATGNVSESQRLLQIALDTSAATGKDLDAVTQAMSRSLAGNDTALNRLIPSLKGVNDPMSELESLFKGASEAAADTDPYKRMEIIFGELQEQVGYALLPILNKFSDWLATPEGQAKLQEIVDGFVTIIEEGVKLVDWVDRNKNWLVPMVVAIGTVTAAWKTATAAVQVFQATAGLSAIAGVSTAVGAGTVGVLGVAAAGAAAGGYIQGQTAGQTASIYAGSGEGEGLFGDAFQSTSTGGSTGGGGTGAFEARTSQNIVINVNNGNVTAQEIANKINRANRATGTNLIRAQ
jgi:hypothetical protein